MPRMSVIVPVYNVERYLAACLDSIRGQSFRDIEIICVNDGSPDRSPALLRMAAAVDDRIKIVNKPNGGLSSARNAGLRVATGDYVLFVDSDDSLQRKACATIIKEFERSDAEIVTFGAYVVPKVVATRWLTRTLSPRKITYEGFEPALLFRESSRPFVWRSAFSREFLLREQLEFDEQVAFGEDQVFYFAAYPVSRRTSLIRAKLYDYRVARSDSLMGSRFSAPKVMLAEHQHIAQTILKLWHERGWLETYRPHIYGFVLEFLGSDVITARGKFGAQMRTELAALLREFFGKGPWLNEVNWTGRAVYQQLAGTGRIPVGPHTLVPLTAWKLQQQPIQTGLNIAERVYNSFPVRALRAIGSRILPASSRTQRIRSQDVHQRIADDALRTEALQLLHIEWLERTKSPQSDQQAD